MNEIILFIALLVACLVDAPVAYWVGRLDRDGKIHGAYCRGYAAGLAEAGKRAAEMWRRP